MTDTMTDEEATTPTPEIITKADLISRAKLCASHDQWGKIKSLWKREEILMAADDETVPHPEHLMRALDSVESLLAVESNKALFVLFTENRKELIKRAERCTDSPFWDQLVEDSGNFKTRLVLRVSGENFGPRDIVDAIHALDVVERKLIDMQERVNARTLRDMGHTGANAATPTHRSKGAAKHRHR